MSDVVVVANAAAACGNSSRGQLLLLGIALSLRHLLQPAGGVSSSRRASVRHLHVPAFPTPVVSAATVAEVI